MAKKGNKTSRMVKKGKEKGNNSRQMSEFMLLFLTLRLLNQSMGDEKLEEAAKKHYRLNRLKLIDMALYDMAAKRRIMGICPRENGDKPPPPKGVSAPLRGAATAGATPGAVTGVPIPSTPGATTAIATGATTLPATAATAGATTPATTAAATPATPGVTVPPPAGSLPAASTS